MAKFKFVAQVNSADGCDEAFNSWHSNVHMPEVLREAGFSSGERMKLVIPNQGEEKPYRYLIIYEGECADTSHALDALWAAMGANKIGQSTTIASPSWVSLYEEIAGAYVKS